MTSIFLQDYITLSVEKGYHKSNRELARNWGSEKYIFRNLKLNCYWEELF